jgi:hypothetical protein
LRVLAYTLAGLDRCGIAAASVCLSKLLITTAKPSQGWTKDWLLDAVPTFHADAVFSCGHHKGREIFMVRIDREGRFLYVLCAFARYHHLSLPLRPHPKHA